MVMTEQLSEQATVTDWPLRLVLVGVTLAVIALVLFAAWRGWRRRGVRQGLVLPAVPADLAAGASALPATEGSYIGTIYQGRLLERVIAGGTRARADVIVAPAGVLVVKQGDPALFIRHDSITGVSTAAGMLQRYFGGHGLLMIDWYWADELVSTGLWFTDPADQSAVRARIERVHLEGVS